MHNKEKCLKASREKNYNSCRGKPIRITTGFSMETLKSRVVWSKGHQVLKNHRCHPRLLRPEKLPARVEREKK